MHLWNTSWSGEPAGRQANVCLARGCYETSASLISKSSIAAYPWPVYGIPASFRNLFSGGASRAL